MPGDASGGDTRRRALHALSLLWPPAFDAAIFDFDGTISFTNDVWNKVDRAFLGARGIEVTAEYQRVLSMLGFEAGARYTIETYHLDESVEDICNEWNRMGRALYESQVTLRPGVRDYLEALRSRGIPCALATINDPDVLKACHHIDVDALFDACVYGREVARPKDSPDIYLEAAWRLGARPARCIVFEDLAVGLRSAKRAGMLACGVASDDPDQDEVELSSTSDVLLRAWTDILLPPSAASAS